MWEHHPGSTSEAEIAETMQSCWVQKFSLEYVSSKVDMIFQIRYCICSIQFLAEIFPGVVDPLKVLSFDFKRVSFMLIDRSVLDLVQLIELSLEDHEVTSWLGVKVNNIVLELFKSINYL